MDKELKAKWVEALRSEKYEQARGSLRDRGAYCCLGVLCDVAGLQLEDADDISNSVIENGRGAGYVPIARLLGGHSYFPLAEMNDRGSSFEDIADYIDANIPAAP